MPTLAVLQDAGHRVALLTDGRLSGASGKVLAALHVTPESACGGALGRLQDGDMITIDAVTGRLQVEFNATNTIAVKADGATTTAYLTSNLSNVSLGRGLFSLFRANVTSAEQGASPLLGNDLGGDIGNELASVEVSA